MKNWKKWLAALAALVFILLVLPGRSFAEDEPEPIAIVSEGGVAAEDGTLPESVVIPEPGERHESSETRAVTYKESGRDAVPKLSFETIRRRLDAIPDITGLYSTNPIVFGSNYRPAVLTSNARSATLKWLNLYREIAGLEGVTFTSKLNTSASYGALCLAMLGNETGNASLTHYPAQPSDMSDADYSKAYEATTSSNLSWSAGYTEYYVLPLAVSGQMEDADEYNIEVVGHRRWLLNPYVQTMGIGAADCTFIYNGYNYDSYYTDIRVFGTNVNQEYVTDYEFIGWPASGDNLSDLFPYYTPWSITLNPDRYQSPDRSKVKVVLTRKSDGKKWTFSKSTDTSTIDEEHDYFNVNNNGYGVANCIIFRPDTSDFDQYDGQYIVDVTGLYDTSGNSTSLHYKVNFTAANSNVGHDYELRTWFWEDDYSSAEAFFVDEGCHRSKYVDATVTKKTTAATCEKAGKTVYTATVTFNGQTYTDKQTVEIPALGHKYGTPTYTWASDYSTVTAKMVCSRDSSHVVSEKANTKSEVTTEPTCTAKGKTTYTASFTNSSFKTQKKTVSNIPALGHDWGEAVFAWDGYLSASAVRTCQRVETHTEKVTCVITGVVTKEPTPTENGVMTYTATATFKDGATATDSKTREILYGSWTWTRLAGTNRYDTAALASTEAYEAHSAEVIIVASGQSFPDALAGSALAGVYECPVLLTNSKKLSDETKAEIQRLAAENCTVLILGGTGTVSEAVENAIRELGVGTDRIAGTNREGTAAAVYERGLKDGGFKAGGTVIVTTGYSFADVLSISPYAYAAKTPILLSRKNGSLSDDTKALLESEGFTKAIIIGGTGSVSPASEEYLKGLGMDVLRLEGTTRYATSAAIMKWELGLLKEAVIQPEAEMTIEGMGVATGTGFPDALGSVSLLGRTHSPLLLVADNSKANREATLSNIEELITPYACDMSKGYIFGGAGTVSPQIENWLNEASMARTAQALLTEETGTVYLLCTLETYKAGDIYNGETVRMVWSGDEVTQVGEWDIPGWKQEDFGKIVIDKSFSSARPVNLHRWFSGLGAETLEGLKYLNTSKTTNMAWMFSSCTFSRLDLSTFDTSSVTDMDNMFEDCQSLEELDLSGFDTSNVQNMGRMFFMCYALKELDLSGFETPGLLSADMMFYDCGVVSLDLSGFGSSEFSASRMFDGCTDLETIWCRDSESRWTFSDPEQAYGTFSACSKLTGVFGDTRISYQDLEVPDSGENAKSAKLGGFFTPKGE